MQPCEMLVDSGSQCVSVWPMTNGHTAFFIYVWLEEKICDCLVSCLVDPGLVYPLKFFSQPAEYQVCTRCRQKEQLLLFSFVTLLLKWLAIFGTLGCASNEQSAIERQELVFHLGGQIYRVIIWKSILNKHLVRICVKHSQSIMHRSNVQGGPSCR